MKQTSKAKRLVYYLGRHWLLFLTLLLGVWVSLPWLAKLTDHALSTTFYAGNGLGSFNSWMRLLTGLLFALGLSWLLYPYLYREFSTTTEQVADRDSAVERHKGDYGDQRFTINS